MKVETKCIVHFKFNFYFFVSFHFFSTLLFYLSNILFKLFQKLFFFANAVFAVNCTTWIKIKALCICLMYDLYVFLPHF